MIPIHAPILKMREIFALPEDNFLCRIEDFFSSSVNKNNIILTNDGRNAIYLALKTLGLKARDEVIIPGYVCSAVKEAVQHICRPICVDIDKSTFNIDSSKIELSITENTKAILIAHLYGNPCDMNEIVDIARDRGLVLIEDVAQSLNGKYHNKNLGSFGDYAIFSFRFTKDITSLRGGALLSNEKINIQQKSVLPLKVFSELFMILASMKSINKMPKELYAPVKRNILIPYFKKSSTRVKINLKTISNYQCYLLYKQLLSMDFVVSMRRRNASFYTKQLEDTTFHQKETRYGMHTYYRYTIQCDNRDKLFDYLLNHGIEADKMYDYSISDHINSQASSKKNLNIPVHHELTQKELRKIVEVIYEFQKME